MVPPLIERSSCMFCGVVIVLNPFVGVWQPSMVPQGLHCVASSEDYDWCHVPVSFYDVKERLAVAEALIGLLKDLAA